MLQLQLQIQHAAFIAPRLDFLDAIAVRFGDTEFDETKCILGKTRVAQAKPVATFGCKVRENLSIQEFRKSADSESVSVGATTFVAGGGAAGFGGAGVALTGVGGETDFGATSVPARRQ